MNNPVLEAIFSRRSVREFEDRPVEPELVRRIIEAGMWAPSGLNNQPWRFAVVTLQDMIDRFQPLTRYSKVIRSAKILLPVFVDSEAMYNEVKDHQAMGACIQNMLLAVHSLGLGAVWLGEILKSASEIRSMLEISGSLDLMAVLAIGWPAAGDRRSSRESLEELVIYKDCNL